MGIFMRQKYETTVRSNEINSIVEYCNRRGNKIAIIMIRQKFFYYKLREWKEIIFFKQADSNLEFTPHCFVAWNMFLDFSEP